MNPLRGGTVNPLQGGASAGSIAPRIGGTAIVEGKGAMMVLVTILFLCAVAAAAGTLAACREDH